MHSGVIVLLSLLKLSNETTQHNHNLPSTLPQVIQCRLLGAFLYINKINYLEKSRGGQGQKLCYLDPTGLYLLKKGVIFIHIKTDNSQQKFRDILIGGAYE